MRVQWVGPSSRMRNVRYILLLRFDDGHSPLAPRAIAFSSYCLSTTGNKRFVLIL